MTDVQNNDITPVSEIKLFHKMKKFMRLTHMEMGGRRGCRGPHGGPGPGPHGMPGGPGMGFHGPHGMPGEGPMGPGPHCPHGRHGFHRPLSRERLLVMIGSDPEGVRQKTLAENAGIGQSSVSELISKLESDGYVIRKVDPEDKRATRLFLTELGEARAAEVEDERKAMFEGIFAPLTEEEKAVLSGILDKLLAEKAAGEGPEKDAD